MPILPPRKAKKVEADMSQLADEAFRLVQSEGLTYTATAKRLSTSLYMARRYYRLGCGRFNKNVLAKPQDINEKVLK